MRVTRNKLLVVLSALTFLLLVTTVIVVAEKSFLQNARNSSDLEPFTFDNRLLRNTKPKHYNILLWPDLQNKTFRGSVEIYLEILNITKEIKIHSNRLNISSIELNNIDNIDTNITLSFVEQSEHNEEFLLILTPLPILQGLYRLRIIFTGTLSEKIVGLYAASLKNKGCANQNIAHSPGIMANTQHSERLSFLQPEHYNLILKPNLEKGTFEGNVTIDLNLLQDQNSISLNIKNLKILDVKFRQNKEYLSVSKVTEIDQLEQLMIYFENVLHKGNYQVFIKFRGILTGRIIGIYSSILKDKSIMVASKFQPTYARQAFPCFDEPEFKATFDVTLIKPTTHIALSNMNEVSTTFDKETKTDTVSFATSVPMSTYLACFVICDFAFKETIIDSKGIGKNFTLRAYGQKHELHKIDFALDIGKRATEFYIHYYNIPFPLPKLDMIAIPDYPSGATEHWGLITYRETSFLVDETKASAGNKLAVANTIAHELAHMWFGNLVTMKWWDEVWLNEGFATYMQAKALHFLEPSWTMLDMFLVKTLHPVLVTDAKLSSHPIVQTVETPDEITSIFDSISYNKGSSILRMLEGFVGEENFRQGISEYLDKYKFGNTVTQQLLDSLEPHFLKENPGLQLGHIMDTWTKQKGYPLITVTPGSKPNTYLLTQSRFLLNPDARSPDDSPFHYKWYVPITYKTNNGSSKTVLWFPDTEKQLLLTLNAGDTWLKVNNNQVGYYIVNYSTEMWKNLINQLKSKTPQLSISDRAHLVNDVFALAQSEHVPYDLALDLLTYLHEEKEYVPWTAASSTLDKIAEKLINSESTFKSLMKFKEFLVEPIYKKQSWKKNDMSVIQRLLRTKVLAFAARCELPAAEAKVKELFRTWIEKHGSKDALNIEPDLREIVYNFGMKNGSQQDWDKLWQIYLAEEDVQELSKLRMALATPRNTSILERFLTLAWDEQNVRAQDYLNVLQYIGANPSGVSLVWDYVRAHWPQLVDRFTLNSRYLGNIIPAITKSFSTEARLKEMEQFFAQYKEAGAGATARESALENVRNNIKWITTNEAQISAWLTDNGY